MNNNRSAIKQFASLTLCVSAACLLTISCASQSPLTGANDNGRGNEAFLEGSFQNLVHGKLVSKDSQEPVAGATVYLPKQRLKDNHPLADLSLNSAIERTMGCAAPREPYATFACTDQFGNFTLSLLNADAENLQLKFQYSDTTVQTQLSLSDLDSDLGTIVFENHSDEEAKKKIAIVLDMQGQAAPMSNSFDGIISNNLKVEFEQQFSKMYDIDESQFDVEFLPFPSLFEDKDSDNRMDIFNYKIIYLITPGDDDLSGLSRENKMTLLDYISKGGELFVTTLSVESEEASMEDYI